MSQFAGLWPWEPDGAVSEADERAQALALVNPYQDQAGYLYAAGATLDHGDETHEQNVFAYIPTEQQVAAALAVLNMQIMSTPEPVADRTPSLAQLSKSLYAQASQLWGEIAAADTAGWDV